MANDAQFELFGESAAANVEATTTLDMPPALRDQPLWMGASSWSFPGWPNTVYPDGISKSQLSRDGLTLYSRHSLLNAVGLDRSYYAPLREGELARYADQVPNGFRFIVKAYRGLTTPLEQLPRSPGPAPDRFLDADYAAHTVVQPTADALGNRLGAIIFQFPPLRRRLMRDPERLLTRIGSFLGALPPTACYGVEVRNPELYTRSYFEMLDGCGANHCFTVHPGAPTLEHQLSLSENRYGGRLLMRWNLNRASSYRVARDAYAPFDRLQAEDRATRTEAATLIASALDSGRPAMVTANNKAEGCAPLTLQKLAQALVTRLSG